MRTSLTIVLLFLLAPSVVVLTLLDGAARELLDADEVIKATQRAGLRGALVDVAGDVAERNLKDNPGWGPASRLQLRATVDSVLSDQWVTATLRRIHVSSVAALSVMPARARLDLRGPKRELEQTVRELGQRAEDACVRYAGAAQCSSDQRAHAEVEAQFQEGLDMIGHIRDEIDVAAQVTSDPERQAEVRVWLARLPQLRSLGAAVLGGLLGLIALINLLPLRRLLGATGAALVVSAGAALVTHAAVAGVAARELVKHLPQAGGPALMPQAPALLARLTTELVSGAAAVARGPLILAAVLGAALVVGALAMPRR